MNLILFGFKSCGKTTVGKLLATQRQQSFLDVDDVIMQCYADQLSSDKTQVLSIPEIYHQLGETAFRHLEKEAVQSLASINDTIIATGGGSVLDVRNARLFRALGTLIYLRAPKATIKQRLFSGELPAFLQTEQPEQAFENMYDARCAAYESLVDIVIDVTGKTPAAIVAEIHAISGPDAD